MQAAFKLYCQTGHSVDAIVGKWLQDYITMYDEKGISDEEVERREELIRKGTKVTSIACRNGVGCYKKDGGYLHELKKGVVLCGD